MRSFFEILVGESAISTMGSAVATMAMANDILGFISIFPQGEDDALPGGADLGTGWNVGTAGQGDGGQCPAQGFWRWQVSQQLHTTFGFSVQIWKKTAQVSNYLFNSKSALPIQLLMFWKETLILKYRRFLCIYLIEAFKKCLLMTWSHTFFM